MAAGRIQSWWRTALRKRAVADFQNLGLTIDGVRETSFEKVTELLGQDKVLLMTAKMLRICGLQEGAVGSVGEMAAVRTFLSAYLISGTLPSPQQQGQRGAGATGAGWSSSGSAYRKG